MKRLQIANQWVGAGEACYIIADAGSNHDRKLSQAKKLVDAAVARLANAVSFQPFTEEKIAADTEVEIAQIGFAGSESLFSFRPRLELSREWQGERACYSRERRVVSPPRLMMKRFISSVS